MNRQCLYQSETGPQCPRTAKEGSIWCPTHDGLVQVAFQRSRAENQAADAQAAADAAMRNLDSTVHETARRQSNWDHRDDTKPGHEPEVTLTGANGERITFAQAQQIVNEFHEASAGLRTTLDGLHNTLGDVQRTVSAPQQPRTFEQARRERYVAPQRPQRAPGTIFNWFIIGLFGILAAGLGFVVGFILGVIIAAITGILALGYLCCLAGLIMGPVLVVSYCRGDNHYLSQMSSHERSDELWRREYRRRTRLWGYGMFGGRRW